MPRLNQRPTPFDRAAGFTLVELLVAITLLGLLSLALAGGLRFGSRAWERVETDSRDLEDLQIARTFLADRLERTFLPTDDGEENSGQGAFQGSATAVRFVSTMPGHLDARGFYRVAISLNRDDTGSNLFLSWQPLDGGTDGETGGSRVLVTSVQSLRVAYFHKDEDEKKGRWLEIWQDPEALPDLVRIAVAFSDDDARIWPPLIVAPRVTSIE